jgi:aminoglycoside phosphotransferase family enzyme/gluconate kinase
MKHGENQRLIEFLSNPATHGTVEPVKVIHTHAAIIFLAGQMAYKIKRPVRYTYLDFSTLERRHSVLQRELALNKLAAPQIYRDLIPITETPAGTLTLGGDGAAIEWALRMNRFPAEAELSQIAARGAFSDNLAATLGYQIVLYHSDAPVIHKYDARNLIGEILEELDTEFCAMIDVLPQKKITAFNTRARAALAACSELLKARGDKGYVRRGHGDLHLRNLVCLDGLPVLFDALEFDEKLGTMDVLYDLAFLIMDMLHSGQRRPANIVLNRYLFHAKTDDHLTGLAALPMFLSIRAAIRAMVAVQAGSLSSKEADASASEAVGYLDDALAFLAPPTPCLVAIGGLSGTGKSTLASAIAPDIGAAPGALHLRSDLERKALFNVDEFCRLPAEAYTEETSQAVYTRLHQKARAALLAGQSVIVDAVHLTSVQRDATQSVASQTGVPFTGLWLEADTKILTTRVMKRKRDASDADETVVRHQAAAATGEIDWNRIDAGQTIDSIQKDVLAVIAASS